MFITCDRAITDFNICHLSFATPISYQAFPPGKEVFPPHTGRWCYALAGVIRKCQLLMPRPDLVLQPVDEVLAIVHAFQLSTLAHLLGRRAQ
jgi:hypothetical protein